MHKTALMAAALVACVAGTGPAHAQGFFGGLFGSSVSTGKEDAPANVLAQASTLAAKQEEWLRPLASALFVEGEWGAVLNLQRLGQAAMERQRTELAAKAFDQAIQRVEAIYANDANAAKARSVFNAEKVKDFKGEPYERAMLYYYRGVLYLHEGDYQNARAAFLAADRHDTLSSAEETAFTGNFGLMKYLASWASQCDGDSTRAVQLLEEARGVDEKVRALPEKPGGALLLVDAGPAPEKWGDGAHREILKFRPGSGALPQLQLTVAGQPQPLLLAGDVAFQATTRGGREVDGIMAGKARFKDGAGAVGDTALSAGVQLASVGASFNDRGAMNLGLAGMLIGMVAKGVEKAVTPAADVRTWATLPAQVLLATAPALSPATLALSVDGSPATPTLHASKGACSVTWLRAATGSPVAADSTQDRLPLEQSRGDRNRAFRAMLTSELLATP